MKLPLAVQLDDIFTFDLEIPYYNWFYPLQHTEDTQHTLVHHSDMLLDGVKGAYVHIPFCSSLCSFCPYIRTSIHDVELRNSYIRHLVTEISSYQRHTTPDLECVFFGGGSPSLLSPDNFADIMVAIQRVFTLSANCEITVEANAMTLNPSLCSALKAFNVSTVRIGVQSFDTHSRALYQLKATIDDIIRSIELVHHYDMQVSCDLLFGHHGQSLQSFMTDIEMANDLSPDTIEIYPINLLSTPDRYWNAVLGAGLHQLRASERIRYFKAGRDRLRELGYHQWSGHGFARSADFDLLYHRCVYGTLGGLVSVGPGAISFDSDYVKWNHPGIEQYMRDVNCTSMPTFSARRITECERKAKRVVTEMPYYGYAGISDDDVIPEISEQLTTLMDAGVITRHGSELALSDSARLQYASVMFFLLPIKDNVALSREIFAACARLGDKFTADMLWI